MLYRLRRGSDDRGSLMLFFLVLIVVGALTGLTVATMVATQVKTRNNQNFTQALPPADANIQSAVQLLNAGESTALPTSPRDAAGNPVGTNPTTGCPTASSWYATRVSGVKWMVYSTKVVNGVTRCVHAQLDQSQRFPLAAFAVTSVTFRGGNSANSYNHVTVANGTGNGDVGSDGSITFNGNATADATQLYNWLANPDTARCSGCPSLTTINNFLDITSAAATSFMTNTMASICGSNPPAWVASQHAYTLAPGPQCYSSMNFDGNTTVTGPGGACDGTNTNDAVVYVTGNVAASNHISININGTNPYMTNACALQIYTTGTSVAIGNHTAIGAAIYAPFATCGGNPSNAQADIYGAAVCNSIGNQGGWSFHYDDALAGIGTNTWAASHYAEG